MNTSSHLRQSRTRRLPRRARARGFAILTMILMTVVAMAVATAVIAITRPSDAAISQTLMLQSELIAQAQLLRSRIIYCTAGSDIKLGGTVAAAAPVGNGVTVTSSLSCAGSSLFSGNDGIALSAAPPGFGNWKYTNNAGVLSLSIKSNSAPDQPTIQALQNAALALGSYASVTMTSNPNDTLQFQLTH